MYLNIHFDPLLILSFGMHLLFSDSQLVYDCCVRGKPPFFHVNFRIVCSFKLYPA
jgi:hypothetical protein